jgi:hypothetical protein
MTHGQNRMTRKHKIRGRRAWQEVSFLANDMFEKATCKGQIAPGILSQRISDREGMAPK